MIPGLNIFFNSSWKAPKKKKRHSRYKENKVDFDNFRKKNKLTAKTPSEIKTYLKKSLITIAKGIRPKFSLYPLSIKKNGKSKMSNAFLPADDQYVLVRIKKERPGI